MAAIVSPVTALPANPVAPKDMADLKALMASFQQQLAAVQSENARLAEENAKLKARPVSTNVPHAEVMPSGSIYVMGGNIYPALKASKATWEIVWSLKDSITALYADSDAKAKHWATLSEEQKCANWEAYAKGRAKAKGTR